MSTNMMIPKMTQLSNVRTGQAAFDVQRARVDTAIVALMRIAQQAPDTAAALDTCRALCFAWLALLEEADGTTEKLEVLAAAQLKA